jgi:hypothetical protein
MKGNSLNIPCICINNHNKPNEIPSTHWLKKDTTYTITEFAILNIQNQTIGVRLAEIDLTAFFPYQFFLLSRFGIISEQLNQEADNAIKELLEQGIYETI